MPSEPEDRQRARGGWLALPSFTWNADRLGSVAQCWRGRPRPDDLADTTPESANPAGLFFRQPAISRGVPRLIRSYAARFGSSRLARATPNQAQLCWYELQRSPQ